jgi:hypothetical protein
MRLLSLCLAVAVFACLPASAQWYEDFDSYAVGSSMDGQGGWEGWLGDPGATAYVTDVQSLSPPNSVNISGASDLVHPYSGYTEGQWVYTAWQYIPEDFEGISYFILLNTYSPTQNWSTQVNFDSSTNLVTSEFENTTLPLIRGQWVELRNEIDLDADTQSFYYGGTLLTTKSWTEGLSGGGALNIGAVDLFANGASPVYYDNMSLVPEPASLALLTFGLVLGLRRR